MGDPVEIRSAPLRDGRAAGANGHFLWPFAAQIKIRSPKILREVLDPVRIVNTESGGNIALHPSALRFQADIGSVEMKAGQLFIKSQP